MKLARQLLLLQVAAFATWGFSSFASAKEEFPMQIRLGVLDVPHAGTPSLSYDVPCSICHIKGNTGAATPIMPFALSLRARGLTGENSTLLSSIARSEADGVDSDGDGVPDIQELRNGTDPNSSANSSIVNDQEPGYGCGGSAPKGRDTPALGGALVTAFVLLCRRRRGQS